MGLTTEEMDAALAQAQAAPKQAEALAIKQIEARVAERSGGIVTSLSDMPPALQAAIRTGIGAGIKAALEIMIGMAQEGLTPEQVAEVEREVEATLARHKIN